MLAKEILAGSKLSTVLEQINKYILIYPLLRNFMWHKQYFIIFNNIYITHNIYYYVFKLNLKQRHSFVISAGNK